MEPKAVSGGEQFDKVASTVIRKMFFRWMVLNYQIAMFLAKHFHVYDPVRAWLRWYESWN